jgi:DNA invertase Pin-like site-specific DNA recombinase
MGFNGNAIIYCRISSDTQNFESQQYSCEEYCKRNNLNIISIYHETGSARSINNLQLLQEIITDNVDINLVVYSVDRLTRNIQDAELIYDAFNSRNINVWSITEEVNFFDPRNKHLWDIRVKEAARESELISQRVKRSIDFRRFKGDYIGNAAYGYKIVYVKTLKDADIMDYEETYNEENFDEYSYAGELISEFITERTESQHPEGNNTVFKPKINPETHYNRRVLMHDIKEMKVVNFIKNTCNHMLSCKQFTNYAELLISQFDKEFFPIRFYNEFDDSDDASYSPDNEVKSYWFCDVSDDHYYRAKKNFIPNSKKIIITPDMISQFLNSYGIYKRALRWNSGMVSYISNGN